MKKKIACAVLTIGLASCATQQGGYYGNGQQYPYGAGQQGTQNYPNSGQYSYQDDAFYNECRNEVDPAGVIAGALIGGLLGNAVGRRNGRAGTTIAGVVVGGIAGAALTRNLSCDDRSYAYRSYYEGLNARRPNSRYPWSNPQSGNRGDFYVRDYYRGPQSYECANYSQTIWINGRPQEATGRACLQPDGTWAIVS